jgi:hypothetical protein
MGAWLEGYPVRAHYDELSPEQKQECDRKADFRSENNDPRELSKDHERRTMKAAEQLDCRSCGVDPVLRRMRRWLLRNRSVRRSLLRRFRALFFGLGTITEAIWRSEGFVTGIISGAPFLWTKLWRSTFRIPERRKKNRVVLPGSAAKKFDRSCSEYR